MAAPTLLCEYAAKIHFVMTLAGALNRAFRAPKNHRHFFQRRLNGAEGFKFFPIDLYTLAATFRQFVTLCPFLCSACTPPFASISSSLRIVQQEQLKRRAKSVMFMPA